MLDFEKNNIEAVVRQDSHTGNDAFEIPKILDPKSYLPSNVMTITAYINNGFIWFNDYNTGLSVDTYDKYYKVEVDISQGYQTVIEQLIQEIKTSLSEAAGSAAELIKGQIIEELENYVNSLDIPNWEDYQEE